MRDVVVTGLGMITPLGRDPQEVLARIGAHDSAAVIPPFAVDSVDCPLFAPVSDFTGDDQILSESKSLRFMSRDAQLAVAAAHLTLEDAELKPGETYAPEQIALYGSTGVAGMTVEEAARIVQCAVSDDGTLDLRRFGQFALKRIRPVLSFRILANMPICFVSIFHNIKGPNAVYTPWEGHGAQAIAMGIHAIRRGDVPCALVGGCDVKTRELAFINLQQLGVFESWWRFGRGCIPAEGAAFLLLEDEESAKRRGRRAYARITGYRLRSTGPSFGPARTLRDVVSGFPGPSDRRVVFAAADGDVYISECESKALSASGCKPDNAIKPKSCMGNLFAAGAAAQVALASAYLHRRAIPQEAMANCFGYGTEQASFLLERPCSESS